MNIIIGLNGRLKSGKVLLLIDGLDEIHNDSDRASFVDNLERFLDKFPKIRMVVTSREAGFALVAPCLMNFCSRWKIAPLSNDAITLLCTHWHNLMDGTTKEASAENDQVVKTILGSDSLARLAENPLLLTMLLVVKHGYGRLPPDRVSLYERAVEVLLDTWNIRGHAALNPREAVPQLSYIAFTLLESGKQTATEKELLGLIEECRKEVPLVRLYAKDTPSEFLKRVELRSSLLLEAGRISENGQIVPFYQFRHLTFQEYLAAVAVVEGHYKGYIKSGSIVSPISTALTSEEWKEVIPMAAVLAKKQADPLLTELVKVGSSVEDAFLSGDHRDEKYAFSNDYRMPAPISRLTQCLVEEAEFSQQNLDGALRLISTFAHGCQSPENWGAVMSGPFGGSLLEEAWSLFDRRKLPRESWMRNTIALMAAHRRPRSDWLKPAGMQFISDLLRSPSHDLKGQGAATICGIIWLGAPRDLGDVANFQTALEENLIPDAYGVWEQTMWALALIRSRQAEADNLPLRPDTSIIDLMLSQWLKDRDADKDSIISFALSIYLMFPRDDWRPILDRKSVSWLLEMMKSAERFDLEERSFMEAAILVAYHARIIDDRNEIIDALGKHGYRSTQSKWITKLFEDIHLTDKEIQSIKNSKNNRARVARQTR